MNLQPGDRVCLKDNPSRVGRLTSDAPIGVGRRQKLVVSFSDGEEAVLVGALEKVQTESKDPLTLMQRGSYGGVHDLRGAITYYRLSGKLANLIYSLNTTNTRFLPFQFKPVLQYLDSPSRGLIIADEVGLGKTIEAGLIWTELRARQDAKRLLVVCPSMLASKWCNELESRFGVPARTVNASSLLNELTRATQDPYREFALVVSMQGTRTPKGWDDEDNPSQAPAAELARFLRDQALSGDEPLLDLVVVDEAHYLRNSDTQSHKFAKLLRPVCDGMVLLSATPIQMASTDLFNLLHLLDEDTFPIQWTYDLSVKANAPLVNLRDQLLEGPVSAEAFQAALQTAINLRWFEGSEQIEHLMQHLPSDEQLSTPVGRAEYAELVDKLNPRAKVITRTLKRHVQELRVQREPVMLRVEMNTLERRFYEEVTKAVREHCERLDVSEGFLLTIPQRQMSSCMAAASNRWLADAAQSEDDAEFLTELDVSDDNNDSTANSSSPATRRGSLMQTLAGVASSIGNARKLSEHDSKFELLYSNLKSYWQEHPEKKVVLFAFFKGTLHHLQRKLTERGITCAVLHGGMDKHATLTSFESDAGPQILLSSEVASEGVDLQFSSLVINYDLPWNPARIEQRIGRIDRIGQEAPKILIWNLVYANTLDERVYLRLLERLNIFKTALGSMEDILGEEVKQLTSYLLSHKLTAEAETRRIEQTAMALARQQRDETELDEKATQLIGHGDFIQNKAKAAHDLGRYVRGDDLYFFVKDYLEKEFPGSRVLTDEQQPRSGKVELSVNARVEFDAYLRETRMIGKTTLLAQEPLKVCFDNHTGSAPRGIERITQDHPLVRFISDRQKGTLKGAIYYPTSALSVSANQVQPVNRGTYVYVIMRWSFSGPRDVERLVYEVRNIETGEAMGEDQAEAFLNTAVLSGDDWFAEAQNTLNHTLVANFQDECDEAIEKRYQRAKAQQQRFNRDRIREMKAALEHDLARHRRQIGEFLARYANSNQPRHKGLIKINENKLKKLEQKFEQRMISLTQKEGEDLPPKNVSSGVIRVY
ncbi:MAG: SNF2-related protein [Aquabacterium sp.]